MGKIMGRSEPLKVFPKEIVICTIPHRTYGTGSVHNKNRFRIRSRTDFLNILFAS